jgi:hypothetical protein
MGRNIGLHCRRTVIVYLRAHYLEMGLLRAGAQAARPMRLSQSIRCGLRYAWRSRRLRATIVSVWVLFMAVSALMALLPLLVHAYGAASAQVYTTLLACVCSGATTGAMVLPRVRARLGTQRIVTEGAL